MPSLRATPGAAWVSPVALLDAAPGPPAVTPVPVAPAVEPAPIPPVEPGVGPAPPLSTPPEVPPPISAPAPAEPCRRAAWLADTVVPQAATNSVAAAATRSAGLTVCPLDVMMSPQRRRRVIVNAYLGRLLSK